jgi:hypothetical protein
VSEVSPPDTRRPIFRKLQPRDEWYAVRVKRETLKLAQDKRELGPVDAMVAGSAGMAHQVKQRVFGVPAKVAPLLVGMDDVGQIQDLLHQHLAEAMSGFTEDELRRIVEQAIAGVGDGLEAAPKANGKRVGGRTPGVEPGVERGAGEMEDS